MNWGIMNFEVMKNLNIQYSMFNIFQFKSLTLFSNN